MFPIKTLGTPGRPSGIKILRPEVAAFIHENVEPHAVRYRRATKNAVDQYCKLEQELALTLQIIDVRPVANRSENH